METIQLSGMDFGVQADSIQPVEGGVLLSGAQVTLRAPFQAVQFYRHGWHSWSLTAWLPLDAPFVPPEPRLQWAQIDSPSLLAGADWQSAWLSALKAPQGQVLLLGALALDTRVRADGQQLHGTGAAAARWFAAFGAEAEVFAAYARHLKAAFGARRAAETPRVWCSWYSLYEAIAEPLLLGTLQGLAGLPYDVFQIDDGWQRKVGDWQPNQKFPSGMTALAQAVRGAGRRPGLWLAPFIVSAESELAQRHPDWLLRGADGQPVSAGYNWDAPLFALDTTLGPVQDWLDALIRQVRAWGYDYLKLDFLYAAGLPGQRAGNVSPEQALRGALQRVRAAAGDDAYLLMCGVPILPAIGLADGIRIGADTAPYWDNTYATAAMRNYAAPGGQNALRTSLHRLWLRPLAHIDPDVAFFRTRFNLLQPDEKAALQALAQICDFRATSDLPFWLDADERVALAAFWQAHIPVEQIGRYRFRLGEDEIDFSRWMDLPAWPKT